MSLTNCPRSTKSPIANENFSKRNWDKISMSSDKDYLMRVPLAFGCLRPAVSFRFETMPLFAWFRFVSFLCHVLAVRFRFVRFHFFCWSASVFRFVSLFQINKAFQLWFRFSKNFCFEFFPIRRHNCRPIQSPQRSWSFRLVTMPNWEKG